MCATHTCIFYENTKKYEQYRSNRLRRNGAYERSEVASTNIARKKAVETAMLI